MQQIMNKREQGRNAGRRTEIIREIKCERMLKKKELLNANTLQRKGSNIEERAKKERNINRVGKIQKKREALN